MDERQMKYYPLISTFVAVFAVALLLLRGCDKPVTAPQDETLWRVKVEQREAVIREKDSVIASLNSLRSAEKIRHTSDSIKQTKAMAGIFKRYSDARNEVQQLSDSTGRIGRYVSVTDSLISAKDSLYTSEVNHRIALEQLHSFEMAAMAKKNILQVEISEEYKARAEISERKLQRSEKRLERKKVWNTIWKSTTAAFVAVTTVLILTE